jgi:hypothetical protein
MEDLGLSAMMLSAAARPFISSVGMALLLTVAACGPAPAPTPGAAADTAAHEAALQPGLIVRFRAPHPLAGAQGLEAEGRHDDAVRLARATLAAGPDFTGLCFNRFTVGGAEIVLQPCTPVPPGNAAAFQRDWIVLLNAMDEVEYAEANAVAAAQAGM